MAIAFDESDDYYLVTDAAELTLQDGDWCIGIWTKLDDDTGSAYQYLLSSYVAPPVFHLYENEKSVSNPDKWTVYVEDDDGTKLPDTYLRSNSSSAGDGKWRLIIVQRDKSESEIQMWFCEIEGTATKEASTADTNIGTLNLSDWYIARRHDGNADRYYGGTACELFKGDFALTQSDIEALAAGLPIKTLAAGKGVTLDLYLPMWQSEATLVDYSGSGNDATRYSAPTTASHPPICTPIKRRRM
jgi:hypothetical protein